MVSIGILTSSRADFGVYKPLLEAFKQDGLITFELIVFGTHLSQQHGYTVQEIIDAGFDNYIEIPTALASDNPEAIATSAALTNMKFASYWSLNHNKYDYIICLGDRYEMFSAAIASVPYGIPVIHFYGGDYSEGAIDNVYRNGMTHISTIHFTSTENCAKRVRTMIHDEQIVIPVGILSLESIVNRKLLSKEEFFKKWNIDLNIPTILITVHPETVNPDINTSHAQVIERTLTELHKQYQLVVTMPNSDTSSNVYRKAYSNLETKLKERFYTIESLGLESYLAAMKHSSLLLGNTSSGISEAASFNKYVVNLGNRQKGREAGDNVFNASFEEKEILATVNKVSKLGEYFGSNIYYQKNSTRKILQTIKASK
jgi:GDP/UDP-N,N'-diacetylbacillosamine 2-epimerase (hydrolysing)